MSTIDYDYDPDPPWKFVVFAAMALCFFSAVVYVGKWVMR